MVANEGEPDGPVDPMGSVSIIDLGGGVRERDGLDRRLHRLRRQAARRRRHHGRGKGALGRPRARVPHRLGERKTAWVTLQEANAVAEVDLATATYSALRGLGFKDHGAARQCDRRERPRQRDQPLHLDEPLRHVPARRDRVVQVKGQTLPRHRERGRLARGRRVAGLRAGDRRPRRSPTPRCGSRTEPRPPDGEQDARHRRVASTRASSSTARARSRSGRPRASRSSTRATARADHQPFAAGADCRRSSRDRPCRPRRLRPARGWRPRHRRRRSRLRSTRTTRKAPSFDTRSDNKGPEPEGVVVGST